MALQSDCNPASAFFRKPDEEAQMESTTAIDRFLQAIENATIPSCDAWSAGAALDATVPNWRMHVHGADAIRAEYSRWFADKGHFDVLNRYPVGGRVVPGVREANTTELIEYTLSWQENGVPHAAHHMHLLTVRDGLIVSDTVMCGGRWPASLLADMEAADATV